MAVSQFNLCSGALLYFYLLQLFEFPPQRQTDSLKLPLDFSATHLDSYQFFRVFPFQRMIWTAVVPRAHFKTTTGRNMVVFQTRPWMTKCKHPVLINRLYGDKWIWLVSFLWDEWKTKSKQTKALMCLSLEAPKNPQIAGSTEENQPLKYTTWQCPFNLFLGHR